MIASISMKRFSAYLLAPLAGVLASCGSISDVTPTANAQAKAYNKVIVRDFKFQAEGDASQGEAAGKNFANNIAAEVTKQGAFKSVGRSGKTSADTLVVEGEITRYTEGNATLRLLVGMGAGSSYFDANVRFSDGASGASLGTIKVDKNSWGLGGGLAAGQTVESFMTAAAKHAASESAKFSHSKPTSKPH